MPDTVARSDAPLPGMQAVAGSILTSGNIPSWKFTMKTFLFLPLVQIGQTIEFALYMGLVTRKPVFGVCD